MAPALTRKSNNRSNCLITYRRPVSNVVNFEQTETVKRVHAGAGVSNAHASVWKKIALPSTIAIKHQLRKLMFEDLIKESEEAEESEESEVMARAEAIRRSLSETTPH